MPEPMNNFTPRAQQAMALARKEAVRLNHSGLKPEHFLLGLVKLGQGVAVSVLNRTGVDIDKLRLATEKAVGLGTQPVTAQEVRESPESKAIYAVAAGEARELNHTYVGTEHLLLALLRAPTDRIVSVVLASFNIQADRVRKEILNELDPAFGSKIKAQDKAIDALLLRIVPLFVDNPGENLPDPLAKTSKRLSATAKLMLTAAIAQNPEVAGSIAEKLMAKAFDATDAGELTLIALAYQAATEEPSKRLHAAAAMDTSGDESRKITLLAMAEIIDRQGSDGPHHFLSMWKLSRGCQ